MCLGEPVVQLQSLDGGRLAERISLDRWNVGPDGQERVAISDSGVGERVIGILLNGILKLRDRVVKALLGSLVPGVSPFEVSLIGSCILRVTLGKGFCLFWRQLHTQLIRNSAREVLLQ